MNPTADRRARRRISHRFKPERPQLPAQESRPWGGACPKAALGHVPDGSCGTVPASKGSIPITRSPSSRPRPGDRGPSSGGGRDLRLIEPEQPERPMIFRVPTPRPTLGSRRARGRRRHIGDRKARGVVVRLATVLAAIGLAVGGLVATVATTAQETVTGEVPFEEAVTSRDAQTRRRRPASRHRQVQPRAGRWPRMSLSRRHSPVVSTRCTPRRGPPTITD